MDGNAVRQSHQFSHLFVCGADGEGIRKARGQMFSSRVDNGISIPNDARDDAINKDGNPYPIPSNLPRCGNGVQAVFQESSSPPLGEEG